LILHLLWCAWVLLGWMLTRRRRLLRTLHIASFVYAIIIELVPWPPCPLTVAETWLEACAGIELAHGPFLVHVLDALYIPTCRSGSLLAARCLFAWRSCRCTCGAIIAELRAVSGDGKLTGPATHTKPSAFRYPAS